MHEKKYIFISDVHLGQNNPKKIEIFCSQLEQHAVNSEVFLLGDIFDAWLGDDTINDWLLPIRSTIEKLKKSNSNFYLMHGNHDFLIGNKLCKYLDVKLVSDPYLLKTESIDAVLTHGDTLCNDDAHYQRIRPILQNILTKKILLALPLAVRKKIAKSIGGHSYKKTIDVARATMMLQKHNCKTLIHGHIHKQYHESISGIELIGLCPWDNQVSLTFIVNNELSTSEAIKI